ncbi:MAG: DUF2892 domain-containing protein [Proteobacteria bacterium]|nr:DUF2892 domain-containing protein [Pseudomonadota bacterium]
MLQPNVGSLDRVLRIAIGLLLIGLSITGLIGAWGWVGLIPLVTGIAVRCPLYTLLGIRTLRR